MLFSKTLTITLLSSTIHLLPIKGAVIASSQPSLLQSNPTTNSSIADLTALNKTVGDQDPHFSYDIRFSGTDLRPQSLLSNGVEALATLAQRDYNARVSGFHGHGPAVDVLITVQPYGIATDLSNQVAVKCIKEGIYYMVMYRQFKEAEVHCKWDGLVIAQVLFLFEGIEGTGSRTDLDNITNPTPVDTLTPSLNALEADFHFHSDSQSLTIWEVYVIIMQGLASMAQFPSTDPVSAFTIKSRDLALYDVSILFVGELIRTRPPFFEYRYIIEALSQIPAWMRSQRRFGEIGIAIIVDGIHVGSGILSKGDPELLSLGGVPMSNSSVTVS